MKESEFGRGLVICLVKFAEHFSNDMAKRIIVAHHYLAMSEGERELALSDSPPSNLNYGQQWREKVRYFLKFDRNLSHAIELWANGASDHLYEIVVPQRWRSTELENLITELQDLGLEMGHGFTGKRWTWDDYIRLWQLTKQATTWIDQHIGLKRQADWGRW